MSAEKIEMYRQTDSLLEKHTYFILGAVGACIAFALSQSKDMPLNCHQLPWMFAIGFWGMSFILGCVRIKASVTTKLLNLQALSLQDGTHVFSNEKYGNKKAYIDFVNNNIENLSKKVARCFRWQFYFFVAGVPFYFVWHLLQMYLNT